MFVSEKTGTLVCQSGNMDLSKNLSDLLIACYVTGAETRTGLSRPMGYKGGWGGKWFCPGCGGRCHEDEPATVTWRASSIRWWSFIAMTKWEFRTMRR